MNLDTLTDSLARRAGYVVLTGYAHHPGGAYSARNVTRMDLGDLRERIASLTTNHPSPTEAAGRGELPALRAAEALAVRVLAMNYRLTRDVAAAVGMIGDDDLWTIPSTACEAAAMVDLALFLISDQTMIEYR